MLTATLVFLILAIIIGVILTYSANRFKTKGNKLADKIEAILPQTQCGQCNYPGCKPYAQAIAKGEAKINQCPPGGQEGVDKLADLLAIDSIPLNEEHGVEDVKKVAQIIEELCIGCTLCIKVCPVDAILGASKVMTTVIIDECTGCDLCPPVCPVDCIEMVSIDEIN